jgi:hypothetical protein
MANRTNHPLLTWLRQRPIQEVKEYACARWAEDRVLAAVASKC